MNNSTFRDLGLLIFRLGVSYIMIAFHGLGKVQLLFSGEEIQFADPIGIGVTLSFVLAAFAEFVCSIFVALGIWTRFAAIPLMFTMFVAVFVFHGDMPFADLPRQIAYLFFFCYVLLIFTGGGKISLGNLLGKRFQ